MLRKLFDAITGNVPVTPADPGFDPMNEPARQSQRSRFGCFFWVILAGVVFSVFFAVKGYQDNKAQQAQSAIATSVRSTEDSFTATPTETTEPSLTFTVGPTATRTPTITTTPATATMTPTATLTPVPQIEYRDRTIVITVRVPWVMTQIVKETVIVVVTATMTPSPTITVTPGDTLTPTATLTPTP